LWEKAQQNSAKWPTFLSIFQTLLAAQEKSEANDVQIIASQKKARKKKKC
jgi:hypothetical protein